MPIEIRELVIRATVDPQGGQGETRQGSGSGAGGGALGEKEKRRLVAETVDQVMHILQAKKER